MITETISQPKTATSRLLFFDLVRNVALLSVILYHAVAAYSTMVPWWSVHDGTSVLADFVRKVFDVYMMPVFFFVAGYFALPSLQKKGLGSFIRDKFKRLGDPLVAGHADHSAFVGLSCTDEESNRRSGPRFLELLYIKVFGQLWNSTSRNAPSGTKQPNTLLVHIAAYCPFSCFRICIPVDPEGTRNFFPCLYNS